MELKYGKYAGKTIDWVKENDLSYYNWLLKNKPSIFKSKDKTYNKKEEDSPINNYKPLSPNTNFDNESSLK